eukprot:scaffold58387_cov48-Phaeocystis_antarctica.AAC.1
MFQAHAPVACDANRAALKVKAPAPAEPWRSSSAEAPRNIPSSAGVRQGHHVLLVEDQRVARLPDGEAHHVRHAAEGEGVLTLDRWAQEALHLHVVQLGHREHADAHEVVLLPVVGGEVLVATEAARCLLIGRAGGRRGCAVLPNIVPNIVRILPPASLLVLTPGLVGFVRRLVRRRILPHAFFTQPFGLLHHFAVQLLLVGHRLRRLCVRLVLPRTFLAQPFGLLRRLAMLYLQRTSPAEVRTELGLVAVAAAAAAATAAAGAAVAIVLVAAAAGAAAVVPAVAF